jgi:predicted ATP-dependent endonuclease of OLD family
METYDAQADLVQMLTSQSIVRQIIYTSHSIGCLPEDLGCGVRVLKMDREKAGTLVVNNFWDDTEPGLSPLLVGIGAATMAFLPTRDCALTEGGADFLLLPSLMREATEKESLGLQFSPGLAVADREQLKVLQTNGKRVLHVVDGDGGGAKIKGALRAIGIEEEDIFDLATIGGNGFVLEDLVEASAYCGAINAELAKSGHALRIVAANLPPKSRPTYIKEQCAASGVEAPGKVAVAYRLLENKHTTPILDKARAAALATMYALMIARQKEGAPA